MSLINNPLLQIREELQRLEELAKSRPLSEKEQKTYDKSLKIYRDNYSILLTERAEGRAEGRAEMLLLAAERLLAKGMTRNEVEDTLGITLD